LATALASFIGQENLQTHFANSRELLEFCSKFVVNSFGCFNQSRL